MAFRRVLVATDFSEGSLAAARLARELAAEDVAFRVVHVVPSQPTWVESLLRPALHRAFTTGREDAERAAEGRLASFLRETGLEGAEVRMPRGAVGREVGREADEFEADLVATGAHGETGIPRAVMGSRARGILHETETNLLVARQAVGGVRRVAVATDFHAPAETAARCARHVAAALGAGLVLLHAADPWTWGSLVPSAPDAEDARRWRVDPELLEPGLREVLHLHNERFLGGKGEEVLVAGPPVDAVTRAAERESVDLLVVGTHGPKLWERAFLGSVAEGVIERAPCSVLVARRA